MTYSNTGWFLNIYVQPEGWRDFQIEFNCCLARSTYGYSIPTELTRAVVPCVQNHSFNNIDVSHNIIKGHREKGPRAESNLKSLWTDFACYTVTPRVN